MNVAKDQQKCASRKLVCIALVLCLSLMEICHKWFHAKCFGLLSLPNCDEKWCCSWTLNVDHAMKVML